MSSLHFFSFLLKWCLLTWFSVLMNSVKPGAMRKQTWATQARFWLFKPEGRRLKVFPEVSVLSGNSTQGCRRADRYLGPKLCLGAEQS